MSDSLTLTVNLSPEAREFVRKRVERGEYPSEAELVSQIVESSMEDAERLEEWFQEPSEDQVNAWMHTIAGPAYDRMKANPGSAIPSEDVQRHLEERRRLREKLA